MTNVVKKGANRASHNAKTNKAAQRTPLPSKPGQMGKGTTASVIREELEKKSEKLQFDKVGAFVLDATKAGWSAVRSSEGDVHTVTAKRGEEVIVISWQISKNGQRFIDNCTYANSGRVVKLRNASTARTRMSVGVEAAAAEASHSVHVRKNKAEGSESERSGNFRRVRLPFDLNSATDSEVVKAVCGRKLVWRNTITGGIEDAVVLPQSYTTKIRGELVEREQRHIKVENGEAGRRILSFASADSGFRSVALESILQVR